MQCHCLECADFRYIIDLFQRVRNARSITVRIEYQGHPEIQPIVAKLEQTAVSKTPFGLILNKRGRTVGPRTWAFDDATVLGRENAHHIWLDFILWQLTGATANHLKRECCDHWCLEYEKTLRRAAFGYSFGTLRRTMGGGMEILKRPGARFRIHYQRDLRDRFWSWEFFCTYSHGCGTYEQYLNSHTALLRHHTGHIKTFIAGESSMPADLTLGMLPVLGEASVPLSKSSYEKLRLELWRQYSNGYLPQLGVSVKSDLLWARPGCCQRCPPYDSKAAHA
jgi:hypothetical protein